MDKLYAKGNTVMAYSENRFYTENIEKIIPQDKKQKENASVTYSDSAVTTDGMIQKAYIKKSYLIVMDIEINGKTETVVIDAANRYFVGENQKDNTLMDGISEYRTYKDLPFTINGIPTVVGLGNKENIVTFASSDGRFFELYIDENGNSLLTATRQIPNNSNIVKIYNLTDGYLLEDASGDFWFARSGQNTLTHSGRIEVVKKRLTCAMADDVKNIASKRTIKKLNVQLMPRHEGKEWE